jgi:hypothetical protein
VQDPHLLAEHIWECINVAWARHETIGEFMAAALAWLESGGRKDIGQLARQLRVERPALLRVDSSSWHG